MRLVNIAFAVLIMTSLMIVIIEYLFPLEYKQIPLTYSIFLFPLEYKQILTLDIFDLCIVVLLVLDFYARLLKTTEKKHISY
jgi:hypothetical protein